MNRMRVVIKGVFQKAIKYFEKKKRKREREKTSKEINNFLNYFAIVCCAGISLEKWRCIHRHQNLIENAKQKQIHIISSRAFVLLCLCAFERPPPCNMIEYDYYFEFSLVELESLANAYDSIVA